MFSSLYPALYDLACREEFGPQFRSFTSKSLRVVKGAVSPPARIVDFGAGPGRLAVPLARMGYVVHAVDPSEEMLDELRRKDRDRLVRTHRSRMESFASATGFDLALCVFSVISFMMTEEELGRSFRSAAGSLKKGGVLLLDVPMRGVFRNRSRSETARADRKVDIARLPGETDIYIYKDRIERRSDGANCDLTHLLRYWEPRMVERLLDRAGFGLEKDFTPRFRDFGSYYWLVSKR